jgi:hypothetical protein
VKIEAATPDEYFAKTGEREPVLRALDELIRKTAPSLERTMVSGMAMNMIGYGMFHYKGKSGREGDWPVVALANQKNYISLYICAIEDGQYVAEKRKDELGKVSVGRSCVRFKKLEDLDITILKDILSTLEKRVAAGEAVYGF